MKRIYISIAFLIVLGFITSCEEKTDWDFKANNNGVLVVESIITDEQKNQVVNLSLTQNNPNDKVKVATKAKVTLYTGSVIYDFVESTSYPGRYISTQTFSAELGKIYELVIEWRGDIYRADCYMVPIVSPIDVHFNAEQKTDSLNLNDVFPLYSPIEQAMYEVDIDWSGITNNDSSRAKLFYYTFNSIDVSEVFRPGKEKVVFPKGSIVVIKKYSLNPEMANYFRAMIMETEWQGGVFDDASASLPTNIDNGAYGYFGVSSILIDTIIAK